LPPALGLIAKLPKDALGTLRDRVGYRRLQLFRHAVGVQPWVLRLAKEEVHLQAPAGADHLGDAEGAIPPHEDLHLVTS
jgi:hypothetical protein